MDENTPPSSPPAPKKVVIIGTSGGSAPPVKPPPFAFQLAFRPPPPQVAPPPDRMYAMALEAERTRDRQPMIGYRLYWFSSVLLGTMDVVADPAGYVVLGSHESCEVLLHDESRIALRHVLLRVTTLDDGFPVLHLMDLRTGLGFVLADGARHRCMSTTGVLVFRLGTHTVVALPSTGRYPIVLPWPTLITACPEPLDLARLPLTLDPPEDAPRGNGQDYELSIEGQGRRGVVRVSAAELARGILIGRSDRNAPGLLALFHEAISRVHLFVIRENDVVHMHDVASLVGTYHGGQRVRWLELRDTGTTVELARAGAVKVTFRAL